MPCRAFFHRVIRKNGPASFVAGNEDPAPDLPFFFPLRLPLPRHGCRNARLPETGAADQKAVVL
jgi:hypothetical protein